MGCQRVERPVQDMILQMGGPEHARPCCYAREHQGGSLLEMISIGQRFLLLDVLMKKLVDRLGVFGCRLYHQADIKSLSKRVVAL